MKGFSVVALILVVFLVFLFASCTPAPEPTPTPAPTPTPTPTPGTRAPQIEIVRDGFGGPRILTSGDPVRFNRTVVFQLSTPSSALIRMYVDGVLTDQGTASPAGEFTAQWESGTIPGTFVLGFTAEQPGLPVSSQTQFTVVVDGTRPFLQSLVARADEVLGAAPTIRVNFNQPIIVGDMNAFTLPGLWTVVFAPAAGGNFNTEEVTLSEDRASVVLTGTWLTDFMEIGATVQVNFLYDVIMQVTDEAGNEFSPNPNIVIGTVIP